MYVSVFVPVPYHLDDHTFVIQLEIGNYGSSNLFFYFRIALTIQGLFWFHTNFRIIFSMPEKNAGGILIGIALNV